MKKVHYVIHRRNSLMLEFFSLKRSLIKRLKASQMVWGHHNLLSYFIQFLACKNNETFWHIFQSQQFLPSILSASYSIFSIAHKALFFHIPNLPVLIELIQKESQGCWHRNQRQNPQFLRRHHQESEYFPLWLENKSRNQRQFILLKN